MKLRSLLQYLVALCNTYQYYYHQHLFVFLYINTPMVNIVDTQTMHKEKNSFW